MSETRPGATVSVTGPVTLEEAPRWREALLTALGVGSAVAIDLAASGPWDLAGLQLLLSALETARRSGTAVQFVRMPEVCLDLAERAGVRSVLEPAIAGRSS